jgi:hypothetical protein
MQAVVVGVVGNLHNNSPIMLTNSPLPLSGLSAECLTKTATFDRMVTSTIKSGAKICNIAIIHMWLCGLRIKISICKNLSHSITARPGQSLDRRAYSWQCAEHDKWQQLNTNLLPQHFAHRKHRRRYLHKMTVQFYVISSSQYHRRGYFC